MIKYFHELTKEEFENLVEDPKYKDKPCEVLATDYPQPEWCTYPHAVEPLGCWSLIGFYVTGRNYCKHCELYRKKEKIKTKT